MDTQLFYFSGTGNTLYAAMGLQKRLPDAGMTPIIEALRNVEIKADGKAVGLIFPLHFFTLPYPVELFLQKVDLYSAEYIFAIVTRGGSPSGVLKDIDRVLKRKGKSLDAFFYIDMPGNCQCHHFEEATPDELIQTEQRMQEVLNLVEETVMNRRKNSEAALEAVPLPKKILLSMVKHYGLTYGRHALNKAFYADKKCTGCGICAQICLANKIDLKNNRPAWNINKECYFCFACINFCPARAIQIKGFKTETLGRYHHAMITPKEIQVQKGAEV